MKIFKWTLGIYLNHIFGVLISLFLTFPLYNIARTKPILYSIVTVIIYTMFIYSYAWRMGYSDARKIPGYEPDIKVPIKVSVYTSIIPIILLLIRIIFPNIMSVDLPFLKGESDFIVLGCRTYGIPDLLYRLWYFHFAGLVPSGNIIAYVLEVLYLPILLFTGYRVGLSRYSILAYLKNKIVFADKNEKEKNN